MNRRAGSVTERACEVQPALLARVATRESRRDQPERANRADRLPSPTTAGPAPSPTVSTGVGTPVGPVEAQGMTTTVARLGLLATATLVLAAIPAPVSAASPVGAPFRQATAASRSPGPAAAAEPPQSSGAAGVTGTLETPSAGVWPLDPQPEVVSGFDPPLSTYGAGHRGADLAGAAGQEVRAAAAGRVTYAGSLAGRGVVVVSHGTTRTTYEPVEAGVERGSIVSAGAVIGTLQRFGSHCAPRVCLHWGLIEGETYLDPLTLVGSGPVRLLPLVGTLPAPAPGRGARIVGREAAHPSPKGGALARLIGPRPGSLLTGTGAGAGATYLRVIQ